MSDTRQQSTKATRESNSGTQAGSSAAQRAADAAEQNSRAAAEAVRQSGESAAEAARRAGESGAETLRRSTEAIAGSQRQIAEEAAGRLQEASRTLAETARGAAEDFRALISLPTAADGGLQELHRSVTDLVGGMVQANLRATEELLRLTSPGPFLELQQRFVREYMDVVIVSSAAVVRAVRQTVDQTLPPLEQHLRERRQSEPGQSGRGAGSYQAAAE